VTLENDAFPPAIVIGLDSLPGIQLARILAAHGVPVIAIARQPEHCYCKTRVCQRILYADTQTDEFIQTLIDLAPSLAQPAVLFPCTDMSVWHISEQQDVLAAWYRILLPSHAVLATLLDKLAFYTYAQQMGLPIPPTFFLQTRRDAETAARQLTFPCVLKPPKRTPRWTTNSPQKVYKAETAAELLALYDRCAAWSDKLIVQQWVHGPDANLYSCNCYFDAAGKPVVAFVACKLRQWPPEAGSSCLGEECRNDLVRETALALFTRVGFHGFGYLEMKQDARTGQHFMMEANVGRPTVRAPIAEAGGVALHYAAYCDAIGAPLPANLTQTYRGAKWIHLHYDLRSALYHWRRGELTLGEWRRSWQGIKGDALWSRDDPAPFWYDLLTTAGRFIQNICQL
jgi:predicted ATP-grasp superfamily ATP-dependent carboligase